MENDETASSPVQPALPTSGEGWDELLRQLLIERFGHSSQNVTGGGYAPAIATGCVLSTVPRSVVPPSGDQVHPAITARTSRRST